MLFDYECATHGVFEAWGNAGQYGTCPKCNMPATQLLGSKGVLCDFADDGFPRAYRMWEDWHRKEYIREGTLETEE